MKLKIIKGPRRGEIIDINDNCDTTVIDNHIHYILNDGEVPIPVSWCVNWDEYDPYFDSKTTTAVPKFIVPFSEEPEIRTFSTGAIRDNDDDKEDYVSVLSWLALRRFGKYMKGQASKYPPGNWKKGIPIEEYEKSLMRHLQKYLANKYEGANLEPEVDHLGAAFFNLQGIMHELEKEEKHEG